jgi:hypothetical protein
LRRIQDEANVAILGADSAESGHSHDDGDSALLEVVADNTFDVVGNDGDEEDEEVAAVNAADENVDENVAAVTMLRPHPQSLPAFVGRGFGVPIAHSPAFVVHGVGVSSAVSSSASRGGGRLAKQIRHHHQGGVRHHCPATSAAEGTGGRKDKKFTYREWESISKAMDRVAESIESGGGDSGSNMMISMLSMQMQQQTQQFSMHQQMF